MKYSHKHAINIEIRLAKGLFVREGISLVFPLSTFTP